MNYVLCYKYMQCININIIWDCIIGTRHCAQAHCSVLSVHRTVLRAQRTVLKHSTLSALYSSTVHCTRTVLASQNMHDKN